MTQPPGTQQAMQPQEQLQESMPWAQVPQEHQMYSNQQQPMQQGSEQQQSYAQPMQPQPYGQPMQPQSYGQPMQQQAFGQQPGQLAPAPMQAAPQIVMAVNANQMKRTRVCQTCRFVFEEIVPVIDNSSRRQEKLLCAALLCFVGCWPCAACVFLDMPAANSRPPMFPAPCPRCTLITQT